MRIFTAIILILITGFCFAGKYEDYMDKTFALIKMGDNKEALDRFIWLHNNGVKQGLTTNPVRLSFNLMYWVDFGKKYPPALDALKHIRDEHTIIILNGIDTCDLFYEVKAINNNLLEDYKTTELFMRIDKEQPILAKKCWVYFKDIAIENDDKYFIGKYIKNLKSEYDTTERDFMTSMRLLSADAGNAKLIHITKDSYITGVEKLLRIAIQNNDIDTTNYINHKYNVISKKYALH